MNLRMPNLNQVLISGRITKDIELKHTPKGTATCNFSIANDRKYKDGDGTWQSDTIFINIQAWSSIAETIFNNAKKGMAVLVEGRLSCRNWTTQDGQNRQTWEVIANNIHILEWLPKDEPGSIPELPQSTNPDVPF